MDAMHKSKDQVTLANWRRARARRSASGTAPVRVSSAASSSWSACMVHAPSARLTRLAISAAAARVKVRHSSRAGGAPSSSKRITRSVSTLVLPAPADAATQTDCVGSAALRCGPLTRQLGSGACLRRAIRFPRRAPGRTIP